MVVRDVLRHHALAEHVPSAGVLPRRVLPARRGDLPVRPGPGGAGGRTGRWGGGRPGPVAPAARRGRRGRAQRGGAGRRMVHGAPPPQPGAHGGLPKDIRLRATRMPHYYSSFPSRALLYVLLPCSSLPWAPRRSWRRSLPAFASGTATSRTSTRRTRWRS